MTPACLDAARRCERAGSSRANQRPDGSFSICLGRDEWRAPAQLTESAETQRWGERRGTGGRVSVRQLWNWQRETSPATIVQSNKSPPPPSEPADLASRSPLLLFDTDNLKHTRPFYRLRIFTFFFCSGIKPEAKPSQTRTSVATVRNNLWGGGYVASLVR